MPESVIVCPHCEKSVELPVTSVTRSRECPLCGKVILLQVSTTKKEKRVKRTALLMPTADKMDALPESEGLVHVSAKTMESADEGDDSVTPKVLVGDIRRRMMHDPEVQARIKTLRLGSAILAGLILLAVVANHFHFWSHVKAVIIKIEKRDELADSQALLLPTASKGEADNKQILPEGVSSAKQIALPQSNAPWRVVEKKEVPQTSVLSEDETKAMKIASDFLNASNVEERLKLVRDVRMMEPRIRSYYEKHDAGPIAFEKIESLEKNPLGECTYAFSVVMPKGERRRMIVGLAKSGAFVVDWASFVLYAEMDWTEFIAQKPETPVLFRVLAVPDDIYKESFSDPKGLVCLKLVDPRSPGVAPVWGYASRGTSLGRNLEFLFNNSLGESLPLMVALKYQPLSSASDQVWISELVAQGWVARGK